MNEYIRFQQRTVFDLMRLIVPLGAMFFLMSTLGPWMLPDVLPPSPFVALWATRGEVELQGILEVRDDTFVVHTAADHFICRAGSDEVVAEALAHQGQSADLTLEYEEGVCRSLLVQ